MEPDTKATFVGGKHTVEEFLGRTPEQVSAVFILEQKKGKEVSRIVSLCKETGIRYQFLPGKKFEEFQLRNHQGFALRVFAKGYLQTDQLLDQARNAKLPLVLALDQVQDEGNLGALARSLFAVGGAGLVLPKNRAATPGRLAQQTAAGALSELPVARETNLARFLRQSREKGFFTWYTGTTGTCQNVFTVDVNWPLILVLGNEEKGVRQGVTKACDAGVTIPLSRGFDSVNVAQAGSMLIMELLRRRMLARQ